MDLQLKGKRALVTGSTGGIGAAISCCAERRQAGRKNSCFHGTLT